MALTNEQREEMRQCVVGPCTLDDLRQLGGKLFDSEERIESWFLDDLPSNTNLIAKYSDIYDEWESFLMVDMNPLYTPTISVKDFISKHLSNATK